jgi:hypothetical protein
VTDADQVIGTIESFGFNNGIEMEFDDPERTTDFEEFFTDPEVATDYATCIRVPAGPFLCLDKGTKTVKTFDGSTPPMPVFFCEDGALEFNTRKETCTAYGFGLDSHFVAGLGNGKAFNLQRVFPDNGNCTTLQLTSGLCAEELYTGRPLLLSFKFFEGEAAEDLGFGSAGGVALEQRSDAVFFPFPAVSEPTLLADKKRWGVKGQETLQDIDVLQIDNPVSGAIDNYAIVTTSSGNVLAAKIGDSSLAFNAFDISSVAKLGLQCNFDEQFYGLEVDAKSDQAVITDKNFCQAFALVPELDNDGAFVRFNLATELENGTGPEVPLVLSTGTTAPLGATSSPGDTFDVRDCEQTEPDGGCTLVQGADVRELVLQNNENSATVFLAKKVPYCTYKPEYCVSLLDPGYVYPGVKSTRKEALDRLDDPDLQVVYPLLDPPSADQRPEEYVFNTTPVLPSEILERFDGIGNDPGQIPNLWILPDFIPANTGPTDAYFYEALFFVTQAQTDDFVLELDVPVLQGFNTFTNDSDGCELASELGGMFTADRTGLERLREWYVGNRASERFRSISGPQASPNYEGHLTNSGCINPIRKTAGGFSLFPYNLALSGCIGFYNANGDLEFDTFDSEDPDASGGGSGSVYCPVGDGDPTPAVADDSIFAKLYVKTYDDLLQHLDQLACTDIDSGSGMAPVSDANCTQLENIWFNGKDKLTKALAATFEPKTSAGNENFGSVSSQLQNYLDALQVIAAGMPYGPDPASRIPEQISRALVLQHLLNDKVLPSIPDNGFNDADQTWAQ